MPERGGPIGPGIVVAATLLTLAMGWLQKSPCLGSWEDGRQYNLLCYSDVVALYGSPDRDRGLAEDRVPYLDAQNEYPVLTGLTMWGMALPVDSYPEYFNVTALALTGAALVTAAALYRIVGPWALLFALAPTLQIYGFVNWDLLAVAFATTATLAHLRDRDGVAGVLLGLGAAAKLYPALLLVPFALGRLRQGRGADVRRLVLGAAATWVLVNLPFALGGFERWSEFFTFNAARIADWDSMWFLLERHLGFSWSPRVLNVLTGIAFIVVTALIWRAAARRRPDFPAWTLGFPLLVAFLLTGKVFSPQYGLWLLPWFALALPNLRLFVAFELADIAVFVTRFQYFAEFQDTGPGLPFWMFEVALLVRAAVLVVCVAAWIRGQEAAPRTPEPALAEAA